LNGIYRIRNEKLKRLIFRSKRERGGFSQVKYGHIKREKNKRAEELANLAIDEFKK